MREKLAALPAASDAVGRTSVITGDFVIERRGSALVATSVQVEVDVSTLSSDKGRRDRRIKTQGLESSRFPKATFSSTAEVTIPHGAKAGEDLSLNLVGDLTVHGLTKRVTIPVKARLSADKIEVAGSITFPMSDYDIDPPSIAGFVSVQPNATMEFDLFLTKA